MATVINNLGNSGMNSQFYRKSTETKWQLHISRPRRLTVDRDRELEEVLGPAERLVLADTVDRSTAGSQVSPSHNDNSPA